MHVLQHWHEQEIKRAFIDSWKIKGESEYLISLGAFYQSLLALYAILSRLKFLCSSTLRFKCGDISKVLGILSELKDIVHNISPFKCL